MSLIFLYVYGMAPTLQATMQISGQLEWPTMSKMQNDCFGMNGLWWQYHHDHILKGWFFGRVDVCECAWCDCFFRCCMFCGWGGHRMSLTLPWPIRIQTFVLRDYGTCELSFLSRYAFCLGTSCQCQETESRFTERIGNTYNMYMSDQGKLIFTRSCMLYFNVVLLPLHKIDLLCT